MIRYLTTRRYSLYELFMFGVAYQVSGMFYEGILPRLAIIFLVAFFTGWLNDYLYERATR